jgi:hypothetical protein
MMEKVGLDLLFPALPRDCEHVALRGGLSPGPFCVPFFGSGITEAYTKVAVVPVYDISSMRCYLLNSIELHTLQPQNVHISKPSSP